MMAAFWTGEEMLVWGGESDWFGASYFNDGALYNPRTDKWRPITTSGAPHPRGAPTVAWTGEELITWGGWKIGGSHTYYDTGGVYNLASNSWRATTQTGAPVARFYAGAAWTSEEMLVWGGWSDTSSAHESSGARYDPATDKWSPVSPAPIAGRVNRALAWTGEEMIVWGGYSGSLPDDGARYNPTKDTWQRISAGSGLLGRRFPTAVWTGEEMIIWGGYGYHPSQPFSDGAAYNPATDTWRPISSEGAPSPRSLHSAVWTGNRMIIWGGIDSDWIRPDADCFNDGAAYDPGTDTWQLLPLESAIAPRAMHAAVWTGSEMIIWGGADYSRNFKDG
jgi:N-acetylneuraminic acid mutarotase